LIKTKVTNKHQFRLISFLKMPVLRRCLPLFSRYDGFANRSYHINKYAILIWNTNMFFVDAVQNFVNLFQKV